MVVSEGTVKHRTVRAITVSIETIEYPVPFTKAIEIAEGSINLVVDVT